MESPVAVTEKPKVIKPSVILSSANPDFIATEISGRPTDTSITINVVPAVALEIYYEYGTVTGTYTARQHLKSQLQEHPSKL